MNEQLSRLESKKRRIKEFTRLEYQARIELILPEFTDKTRMVFNQRLNGSTFKRIAYDNKVSVSRVRDRYLDVIWRLGCKPRWTDGIPSRIVGAFSQRNYGYIKPGELKPEITSIEQLISVCESGEIMGYFGVGNHKANMIIEYLNSIGYEVKLGAVVSKKVQNMIDYLSSNGYTIAKSRVENN